jgi:integrase
MPNTWSATTIQFLTQPELRAFFRVITRQRDRTLFLIAYRHGLRASEVGLLQVEDLNLEQQRITIHRVKRSLPGIYPLRPECHPPRTAAVHRV